MDFSIDRAYFLKALSTVGKAISPNSPMPVLSGIDINVSKDEIVLTGSDEFLTIRTTIRPGELSRLIIKEPGHFVVSKVYILSIVQKINDLTLDIFSDDGTHIFIETPASKFLLNALPAAEYPNMDLSRPEHEMSFPAFLMKDIVNEVGYAAAVQSSRQVLMGINFVAKEGTLTCHATDSYRMARKVCELKDCDDFAVTIPVKTLNEVISLIPEDTEMLKMYMNRKKVQFYFGPTLVQSGLYDGNYPDLSHIIPASHTSSMKVNVDEIMRVVDGTSIYSSSSNNYQICMNADEGGVRVNALSNEIGKCDQDLTATFEGEPIKIYFNARYMLNALKGLHSDGDVLIEMSGPLKPMKITNPDDPTLVMIVVPIRSY